MNDEYELLGASLALQGLLLTAAELHGMVCGQLCSDPGPYSVTLTGKLVGQDVPGDELVELFRGLATEARDSLSGDDFSFSPLLPDDDEELGLRLHALGRWCEGFTMGYAAGCSTTGAALQDEAREVLADFTRIAEVEAADVGDSEADYMEVMEYVRVATASLFWLYQQERPTGLSENDELLH